MNNHYLGFEKTEIEQSISQRFEKVVNHYPDHLAIKTNTGDISYQELNQKANQTAQLILEKRENQAQSIAIILEQDICQFIAMIATWKTGNPYVILEPTLPEERLIHISENLLSNLIITNNKNLSLTEKITVNNCQLINIDQIENDISTNNLNLLITPDNLATILFSSGSTGKPKGVKISHRQILHRVWFETNNYNYSIKDNISLLYSSSFSAATSDIYNPLLNGSKLCLYDLKKEGVFPLIEWVIKEEISFLHLPAAFFQEWLETLTGKEEFKHLSYVRPSGRLYYQTVEKARKYLPEQCKIIQNLSSSETSKLTILTIDQDTKINQNIVSVGYVLPDKEIFLLDENKQKVGFNQIGEIAVKSRYLASGYWGNEELTKEKFIPCENEEGMVLYLMGDLGKMQPDGSLELLGRKDSMVKIRGYTVYLTEIEMALLELPEIKETTIITQEYSLGENRLICYIVTQPNTTLTAKQLREFLTSKLPEYMIPFAFIFLDKFPVTEIGKIDKKALPIPEFSRDNLDNSYLPSSNLIEEQLTEIWQEVLKFKPIGMEDNFLSLGGNSLLATQIVNRIIDQFKIQLSLQELFNTPSIAIMAKLIESKQNELETMLREIENLTDEQVVQLLNKGN